MTEGTETGMLSRATFGEAQLLRSRTGLITAFVAIMLFKLWLVHGEEICGSATRYDALWFVNSAKHWYWGAEYNWVAFVRPAAYPLWIAVVHFFGVRQRIAIELLQLGSFAVLLFVLRRAGLPRSIVLIAFAAAAFHPGGFQLNNYTMADTFYTAMLPLVLAGMAWMMMRPTLTSAVATGLALAVLWNTREESVLIIIALAAFLAIWSLREWKQQQSWSAATRRITRPAALMLGTLAALDLLVCAANHHVFRSFAKSDMVAPSFEAAFSALVRIDARTTQRYIPIPAESLREAYRVSPSFALLKGELEGRCGDDWRTETFNRLGVRNEIGVNWLMWALRDAARRVGMHDDPRKAKSFYKKVAREINQACDESKVKTRIVWASFIGPVLFQNARSLPSAFARIMHLFVGEYEMARARDAAILLPEERALYDDMASRSPSSESISDPGDPARTVENWIGRYHRFFVFLLGGTGVVAAIALFAKRNRLSVTDPLGAVLALVAVAIVSRILLFTVLTATSWPCDYDRFLYPVMPLSSIFLIALVYEAVAVLRRADRPAIAPEAPNAP
ncbi:MAG: hypothetical protein ACR2MF_08380 [Chthoniobacterales bacterium]